MLIGFTVGSVAKLDRKEIHILRTRGFQVPWKRSIGSAQYRLRTSLGVDQVFSAHSVSNNAKQLHVQEGGQGEAPPPGWAKIQLKSLRSEVASGTCSLRLPSPQSTCCTMGHVLQSDRMSTGSTSQTP